MPAHGLLGAAGGVAAAAVTPSTHARCSAVACTDLTPSWTMWMSGSTLWRATWRHTHVRHAQQLARGAANVRNCRVGLLHGGVLAGTTVPCL